MIGGHGGTDARRPGHFVWDQEETRQAGEQPGISEGRGGGSNDHAPSLSERLRHSGGRARGAVSSWVGVAGITHARGRVPTLGHQEVVPQESGEDDEPDDPGGVAPHVVTAPASP